MLDIRHVVEHIDEVRTALARRNPQATVPLETITVLASQRTEAILAAEGKAAERNSASKEMATLPKQSPQFVERRERLRALSEECRRLEKQKDDIEAKIAEVLLGVPNIPDASTPDGKSELDNPVIRVWGE